MTTPTQTGDPVSEKALHHLRSQPFPFLSIFHQIQEESGVISRDAIETVAREWNRSSAKLFSALSFYHYFKLEGEPGHENGLCIGPVCALQSNLSGATGISCPGRCDTPPAQKKGPAFLPADCPLPPKTEFNECLFTNIRTNSPSLQDYRKNGGYQALPKTKSRQDEALTTLEKSGLVGRGGAGFPTAAKWTAVRDARADQKYIVANADEGEPGCFKDRVLMVHQPHALLEGMLTAGLITGATIGIIYLRYEYPECLQTLTHAIDEASRMGILGDDASGSGQTFHLYVRRGAGAYICGEETSLLNSLEGIRAVPRTKPPYPTTFGLDGRPTVINNIETLSAIGPILRQGAEWYHSLGVGSNTGTKIISLSGDIIRPGNYEIPLGTPLQDLLNKIAGGVPNGKRLKAVTMAGISGGFLGKEELHVNLDISSIRNAGSLLGAGGIIVYNETRCMVRAALSCMTFFAEESCGRCFPCRIGTTRTKEILTSVLGPSSRPNAVQDIKDIGHAMEMGSLCGLGKTAPLVTKSLLKYWPEEVEAHLKGNCLTGECNQGI